MHRPIPIKADVTAVRALAHPLRLELLDLLRFEGPSTATLLANRVGESSGTTSYHLRQLARYGYIEEARQVWAGTLVAPQGSAGNDSGRR